MREKIEEILLAISVLLVMFAAMFDARLIAALSFFVLVIYVVYLLESRSRLHRDP